MVFFCGDKRMQALPTSFDGRSQRLDELVVYSSRQVEEIVWLKTNIPQWVVFFSPSGVDAAQRMTNVPWGAIKKAALGTNGTRDGGNAERQVDDLHVLGKSSAAALEKAALLHHDKSWEAKAVAAKPTPEELVAAIVAHDKLATTSSD
ncbi:hypothetical protein DYB30_003441 [Aphanomyces astaci]|uniref:Uroporphyrinogen-III synthase n=1 Tax=Aphanomyces astaci TaxID=112090 RepID=A0A397DP03_APHAT|nr:hypothetical protein DYB30_003441 [Aphanomyces astaci]